MGAVYDAGSQRRAVAVGEICVPSARAIRAHAASTKPGGLGERCADLLRTRGRDAAAVWTSTDGITWNRVAHDEAVFGSDLIAQRMNAITVGGPGLVAVGRDGGRQAAAVWTSP